MAFIEKVPFISEELIVWGWGTKINREHTARLSPDILYQRLLRYLEYSEDVLEMLLVLGDHLLRLIGDDLRLAQQLAEVVLRRRLLVRDVVAELAFRLLKREHHPPL